MNVQTYDGQSIVMLIALVQEGIQIAHTLPFTCHTPTAGLLGGALRRSVPSQVRYIVDLHNLRALRMVRLRPKLAYLLRSVHSDTQGFRSAACRIQLCQWMSRSKVLSLCIRHLFSCWGSRAKCQRSSRRWLTVVV